MLCLCPIIELTVFVIQPFSRRTKLKWTDLKILSLLHKHYIKTVLTYHNTTFKCDTIFMLLQHLKMRFFFLYRTTQTFVVLSSHGSSMLVLTRELPWIRGFRRTRSFHSRNSFCPFLMRWARSQEEQSSTDGVRSSKTWDAIGNIARVPESWVSSPMSSESVWSILILFPSASDGRESLLSGLHLIGACPEFLFFNSSHGNNRQLSRRFVDGDFFLRVFEWFRRAKICKSPESKQPMSTFCPWIISQALMLGVGTAGFDIALAPDNLPEEISEVWCFIQHMLRWITPSPLSVNVHAGGCTACSLMTLKINCIWISSSEKSGVSIFSEYSPLVTTTEFESTFYLSVWLMCSVCLHHVHFIFAVSWRNW